jgi:tRNA G46 methylase TrmB
MREPHIGLARMRLRPFLWIVAKNMLHPFRRYISRYLQRRHARFDEQAGVYTTGRVTLEELGLSPDCSVRYKATPINFFHAAVAKLSLDYPRTVFIDFGSGKGRVLLLASHYPLRSIIGVEISEALCQIAIIKLRDTLKRLADDRTCNLSTARGALHAESLLESLEHLRMRDPLTFAEQSCRSGHHLEFGYI